MMRRRPSASSREVVGDLRSSSLGWIGALSRGLHPGGCETDPSAHGLPEGLIDESQRGELVTLAGWVGTVEAWDAFTPKWKAMLDSAPHPVSEFHAAHIAHSHGEFSDDKGWTKDERSGLVRAAGEVIADPDPATKLIAGIGCTVVGHLAFPMNNRPIEATTYDFWKLCLHSCLL